MLCNYRSARPGYLGKGITSLMLSMPVANRSIRSKPRPKPQCLTVPYRLRSRYHSYGSSGRPISLILQEVSLNFVVQNRNEENQPTRKQLCIVLLVLPVTNNLVPLLPLASTNQFSNLQQRRIFNFYEQIKMLKQIKEIKEIVKPNKLP